MRVLKLTGLSLAALATLAVGTAPAFARPYHHPARKVCRTVHDHGHVKRVCRWVR